MKIAPQNCGTTGSVYFSAIRFSPKVHKTDSSKAADDCLNPFCGRVDELNDSQVDLRVKLIRVRVL